MTAATTTLVGLIKPVRLFPAQEVEAIRRAILQAMYLFSNVQEEKSWAVSMLSTPAQDQVEALQYTLTFFSAGTFFSDEDFVDYLTEMRRFSWNADIKRLCERLIDHACAERSVVISVIESDVGEADFLYRLKLIKSWCEGNLSETLAL